jgi:ketol-acid reductoisomerase
LLTQQTYTAVDDEQQPVDTTPFDQFLGHDIHSVLRVCAAMRPAVDLFVE